MASSTNKGFEDYATQTEGSDSDRGALKGSRKTTFGTKAKRHCARFWWLDLLIAVVIILVVLLPILFVGIKHVAQSELNKAVLDVTYQGIADPRPNSIQLTLKTSIISHSSYTPIVDSFNGSFFLENTEPNIKPFGYVEIPRTQAEAVTNVTVQQRMAIADMDQFIAFNKVVMNSEEFRVALRGKTQVELNGLPHYDVDYNKVATMKGLNKLSGFSISKTQIKLTPEPDGATMLGQVSIPNPSVFSIEMGNVTMNLYTTNKTYIGYTLIEDLTLNPGSNMFNMRSYVNLTQAVPFVVDNILPLEIVGNSSVNAAGEHLPYFEAAIRDNVISYRLNITA